MQKTHSPSLLHRSQIIALFFALILAPSAGLAEGPTSEQYGVVLNLSGKQRMLTQKMSKEFLMVAYGHQRDDSKLSPSIALCNPTHHKELQHAICNH